MLPNEKIAHDLVIASLPIWLSNELEQHSNDVNIVDVYIEHYNKALKTLVSKSDQIVSLEDL